jgi:hypothetical protein
MKIKRQPTILRMLAVAAVSLLVSSLAGAQEKEDTPRKPIEERNLWRLSWSNDAFVRTDNAFTNGWSLQRHSHEHDTWDQSEPSRFSGWISRTIPGLGDAGDRIVKRGTGISQVMFTPEDVSNPDPQPEDVPWSGALGWTESWYAFDTKSLSAFQIYVGILGPYSFAEHFQILIHDWINADEPLGWDNQLATEPLVNLNYAYKRTLLQTGETENRFSSHVALGAEGGLGNFMTFARASLEWRFGWGVPKGFIYSSDPGAYGVMLAPEMGVPDEFSIYLSIAARVSATAYTVFWDGNLLVDSPHPGLPYDTVSRGAVFGLHLASRRFSVHFNFYSYDELPFESVNPLTELSWGNITFEYRF